jgi:hypothetical protein
MTNQTGLFFVFEELAHYPQTPFRLFSVSRGGLVGFGGFDHAAKRLI